MFAPGSVLWLLRHELRLTWRGMFARGMRGEAGRIALFAFFAAICLAGGYGVSLALGRFPPQANAGTIAIVSVAAITIFTFMVSQALILITQALYQRGDLDLLLASPLPPWRILLVRMGAITLNVALLYLGFCAAVLVWSPLTGAWRWFGVAPSVLALAFCATALSILVASLLFMLVGPRMTRTLAQVIAALSGAAVFLILQSQNLVAREDRADLYRRVFERVTQWFGDAHTPWALPARAVLGEWAPLTLWLVFAIAFYVVSVWWFSRRFLANAAAIVSSGRRSRRSASTAAMQGGLFASMVRKEWRLLLRDPLLLSQVLLQLIYLAPVIFVVINGAGDMDFTRNILALLSGFLVFVGANLAASLVWLTVSAEDAPDLIAAAPVRRDDVDFAKAAAAGIPVAALMLAPVVAAAFVSIAAAFWLALGTCGAIFAAGCIGVWHQRPGDRKNFRRRRNQSFLAGLAQFIVTMAWSAATGAAVAGWPIVSIIPTVIALGLLLALHESRIKR